MDCSRRIANAYASVARCYSTQLLPSLGQKLLNQKKSPNSWIENILEGRADDELCVLDIFDGTSANEEGEQESTFGVLMSSRALLKNLKTAIDGQGQDLVMCCDGTYKLHIGKWALINVGVIGVCYDRKTRKFVQRFFPYFVLVC